MNDLIRKAISLGLGVTAVSREKIQQFVDELVVKGELGQNESKDLVNSLISKGQEQQNEIMRMVREQVRRVLSELDVATKQDLQELEAKLTGSAPAAPSPEEAAAPGTAGTPSADSDL